MFTERFGASPLMFTALLDESLYNTDVFRRVTRDSDKVQLSETCPLASGSAAQASCIGPLACYGKQVYEHSDSSFTVYIEACMFSGPFLGLTVRIAPRGVATISFTSRWDGVESLASCEEPDELE